MMVCVRIGLLVYPSRSKQANAESSTEVRGKRQEPIRDGYFVHRLHCISIDEAWRWIGDGRVLVQEWVMLGRWDIWSHAF